jgi:hypothetical protein
LTIYFRLPGLLNQTQIWAKAEKSRTFYNTDGLINCLRQPGQLLNRLQKFMREKFNQLIKFCGTRTDPAAETKSIGLPADPSGVMVFASRQFHHDPKFTYIPGACKNHATATLSATQLNRRAVIKNAREIY